VFRLIFQSLVTSTGVDLGERGDRSPKFGVEGTLMSMSSQSFCLSRAFHTSRRFIQSK